MLNSRRQPPATMNCTLLIPELLPPADFGADAYAGLHTPNLATALARGEMRRDLPRPFEAWLCERFGVARQHDFPLAPLMLKADGGEPGLDYWLCAEPVRLRVDRN